MIIFIAIISAILFAFYFRDLKRNPITTKKMVVIAMMSGLSFMLSLIQFVKYPQGGGITLFSMLPIMILSLLYGRTAGITGGLIWGFLSLLNGAYVIHPVQFLLDCLFGPMALGFTCVFGSDKKYKVIFRRAICSYFKCIFLFCFRCSIFCRVCTGRDEYYIFIHSYIILLVLELKVFYV